MPQQTNLNTFPYFDDFDPQNNYQRVLFKPGYPVQARELTTIQSTLQNQIEQLGNFTLKSEGTVVIPGNWEYTNQFDGVELEPVFNGVDVSTYLNSVSGFIVKGFTSGVRAKVIITANSNQSEFGVNALYLNYIDSGVDGSSTFLNGEQLIVESDILINNQVFINSGEAFARTLPENSNLVGSAFILNSGVFYLRGTFVTVTDQILILDSFSSNPSYKVGFLVEERIVTAGIDPSLNDNSNGSLNYAAPGADRLSIQAFLTKIPYGEQNPSNFVQIASINNGILQERVVNPQLGELRNEFARRTYDESGDYYVIPPTLVVRDTLNDFLGNNGIYPKGFLTSSGNIPSEDLGTYQVSALKAYVKGYEVETISSTFIDFQKPRTTKTLNNQELIYSLGPSFRLNRVHGCPTIGISTSYYVTLRDSRVGTSPTDYTITGVASTIAPGKEIGLARVYDFALESGSYSFNNLDLNEWDISLFDVQTYTEISLNEPITLSTPTQIKGKSSGAVGFLRYDISNSGILTAYNITGKFSIGERLIFDGIENTRVSTAITSYGIGDVKSIYSNVGTGATFSADTIQYTSKEIGQVNISAVDVSSGISTVTTTDSFFVGIATVGNLVSFSNPDFDVPTYARITQVQRSYVEIIGVTTVSGICEGSLPSVSINPSDFKILKTSLLNSSDNSLYTVLPKEKVSSVDLSDSNLTIRRQYDVNITSNSVTIPSSIVSSDEYFLPYDEERYVLIRDDGGTEVLSEDKLVFNTGGRGLEINGLSTNGPAKLITTLRKVNVKEKVKNKQRINSIIVSNSKYEGSGIGNTTLNDGLTYGNYPYGTRVQDEDICLLKPDVTKIYAILESSSISDPELPIITFSTLTGPSGSTSDVIIGERILNNSGNTIAICVAINDNSSVDFVYLNDGSFSFGETVTFEESGVQASVDSVTLGSENIGYKYDFIPGYSNTIYGYSKLVRKNNVKDPTKKIRIIYESADISNSDRGDIVTANSYSQFDYSDLPTVIHKDKVKTFSDIIDVRPRVSPYSPSEGSRSPFEFLGRNFTSEQNNYTKILAADESININYSFYLPRIDRIYITKDGLLQLKQGEPSENPKPPIGSTDAAIEMATISLPAYLYSVNESTVSLSKYKRYRMSDIQKLDERISNLEFYTTLSLLETDTSNFSIKDANGLDRFKSGFFVDNFSGTLFQRKVTGVKNSIDIKNLELRPTHYTTELDLVIGSESLLGLTQSSNESVDLRFVEDLVGSGVRKTGQLLTLDYDEVLEVEQPYATKVVNVAPFRSTFYAGTIQLFPASDVWIDQVRLEPTSIKVEGNFSETLFQLAKEGFDAQTGFGPVTWNSWEYTWTGEKVDTDVQKYTESGKYVTKTTVTTTKTGTKTRSGERQIAVSEYNNRSFGDAVTSLDLIPYMRSRNIEFTAKRMKPFTRVYNFFDNVDVTEYCTPKLLEISMLSGSFIVGEIVQVYAPRIISRPIPPVVNLQDSTSVFRPTIPPVRTPINPFINPRLGFTSTEEPIVSRPVEIFTRTVNARTGILEPGRPTVLPPISVKCDRRPSTTPVPRRSCGTTLQQEIRLPYRPSLPKRGKIFTFRAASPNHKYGPYNNPTDVFTVNPYSRDVAMESVYSETSTILNVDTYSLANMVQGRFYGHVERGMILEGATSRARAVVIDVRLVTDNVGTLIGSFFIPDPNVVSNPKFQTGIKLFRMTNSETNTTVGGLVTTTAEEKFYAEGTKTNVKENILVTRDLRLEPADTAETDEATNVSEDVSYQRVPIPPPPAPSGPPIDYGQYGDRGRPRSSGSAVNVRPVADIYNSRNGQISGSNVGGIIFNKDGTVTNGVYLGNGQYSYQTGASSTWTGQNGNSGAGKNPYQTGRGSTSYSGPRSGPTYPGRFLPSGQAY